MINEYYSMTNIDLIHGGNACDVQPMKVKETEYNGMPIHDVSKVQDKNHWIDNADSYICPKCGIEVNNPSRYEGCKCPNCGFQDEKDKEKTQETKICNIQIPCKATNRDVLSAVFPSVYMDDQYPLLWYTDTKTCKKEMLCDLFDDSWLNATYELTEKNDTAKGEK